MPPFTQKCTFLRAPYTTYAMQNHPFLLMKMLRDLFSDIFFTFFVQKFNPKTRVNSQFLQFKSWNHFFEKVCVRKFIPKTSVNR